MIDDYPPTPEVDTPTDPDPSAGGTPPTPTAGTPLAVEAAPPLAVGDGTPLALDDDDLLGEGTPPSLAEGTPLPSDDDERTAWERWPGEPAKGYAAFRIFRDLPAFQRQLSSVAEVTGLARTRVAAVAERWCWTERVEAWDDECHRVEDAERMELIREMHRVHGAAGRAALLKGLEAMQALDPADIAAGQAARLMELGARLERSTLTVSVEELQGLDSFEPDGDDPWSRIADALTPRND